MHLPTFIKCIYFCTSPPIYPVIHKSCIKQLPIKAHILKYYLIPTHNPEKYREFLLAILHIGFTPARINQNIIRMDSFKIRKPQFRTATLDSPTHKLFHFKIHLFHHRFYPNIYQKIPKQIRQTHFRQRNNQNASRKTPRKKSCITTGLLLPMPTVLINY